MDAVQETVAEVEISLEQLDKIVQLKVANVPDWQIAKGFGLAEDLLMQLYETEEYKGRFSDYFGKQIEELDEVNKGWDGLEGKALRRLHQELDSSFLDPEFALKVAHVSNKAARRPLVGNKPIDANQGGTAVIYINNNFVERMQNLQIHQRNHLTAGGEKKQNDFVDPDQVENILLDGKKLERNIDQEIADILGDPLKLVGSG